MHALPFNTALTRVTFCLFLGFSLIASALSHSHAEDAGQRLAVERLTVASADGELVFEVEVAANDLQRARGLMFREQMAADHGMLFVFESEGERYFWMKNTPLPLDIIYIAENGRIVSIAADTEPFSEAVIPSRKPARFVLELNAGTARKQGIAIGDTVSSPSMQKAR